LAKGTALERELLFFLLASMLRIDKLEKFPVNGHRRGWTTDK
jgi:hypothetical protein